MAKLQTFTPPNHHGFCQYMRPKEFTQSPKKHLHNLELVSFRMNVN